MADVGLSTGQIDWVVPHQANKRIIDATAKKLGLPAERVVLTVDQHANTSAASVPLALDLAVRDGRIKPGDLVVLEAMGGGFTWGAAVLRVSDRRRLCVGNGTSLIHFSIPPFPFGGFLRFFFPSVCDSG